jgi:hypothetical protein
MVDEKMGNITIQSPSVGAFAVVPPVLAKLLCGANFTNAASVRLSGGDG